MTFRYLFIIFLWLFVVPAQAGTTTETPASLLAAVPALPSSIHNARCEIGRDIAQRAEQIMSGQYNEYAQSAGQTAQGTSVITDKQAEAISKLADGNLVQCLFDVGVMKEQVVEQGMQHIEQNADALQEEFIQRHEACGSGIGMDVNCHNHVVTEYKMKMAGLAEKELRDLRSSFGEWQKKAAVCIGQRETAVTAVLESGKAFNTQATAMRTQTYSLAQLVAQGYTDLCETAISAGQRLENQ